MQRLEKTQTLKLSYATYGPAQCKIENIRWGGHTHADVNSYTLSLELPEATRSTDPDSAATDNGSADAAAAAAADMPVQIDLH